MQDVFFGQYYLTDSIIHRLDARLKIALTLIFAVLSFLIENYAGAMYFFIFVFFIIMLSKVPFKIYFKSIKMVLLIILFTSIMNLFYSDGPIIFAIGSIRITQTGMENSAFIALRLLLLFFVSSILTYTTSPSEFTHGIESLLRPLSVFKVNISNLSMMITLALRFVPILLNEANKISAAQKARGAQIDSGNLKKRVEALGGVIIPLFLVSFKKANDLAVAMESRCYSCERNRTKMKILKFKKIDYSALLFSLAVIVAFLIFNFQI